MMYPVTDANLDTDSYHEFADGPWLTREAMRWFWDAYLPDESQRTHPTASPLQATLAELSGLPPAMLVTDENDVLRDEGEAYTHKLAQAGVDVITAQYLGTIHDFALLNPIADAPAAGRDRSGERFPPRRSQRLSRVTPEARRAGPRSEPSPRGTGRCPTDPGHAERGQLGERWCLRQANDVHRAADLGDEAAAAASDSHKPIGYTQSTPASR